MRKWGIQEEGVYIRPDRKKLPMKAEEFIKRVLEGERDFSYISLKPGTNLAQYDSYNEMNLYLAGQNLAKEPLMLTGSELLDIVAPRLYIPHVKADCVHFGSAVLAGANIAHGMFYASHFEEGSKLYYVNATSAKFESACVNANLWLAGLVFAVLNRAKLGRSSLSRANIYKAEFQGADLRQVFNFKDAENAKTADYTNAKVSHELKNYLNRILEHEVEVIVEAKAVIGRKSQ